MYYEVYVDVLFVEKSVGQRVSLASHIQTDGVSDRQKTDRSRSSTGKHGSLSAGNRFGLSDNSRMVSGDDSYGGSHGPDRIRKKEHIHKVSGRVISGRMAAWRYGPGIWNSSTCRRGLCWQEVRWCLQVSCWLSSGCW